MNFENKDENVLEKYWDYEKNINLNPFEISKGSSKTRIWMKCQEKDYHGSYETMISCFYRGDRCPYCGGSSKIHPKDSFGQMLVDEYGSLEVIWDFKKNGDLDPFELSKNSHKKVWMKCLEKDYHGSYKISCALFVRGSRCGYCAGKIIHTKDSFAQYHIDNTDKDFLEKYWSNKNAVNPFNIAPNSNKVKVWIKCQEKDYHEDYEIKCNSFTQGNRCLCCAGKKVHKNDSFAQYHINNTDVNFLEKYWDENNKIDPWEILPYSDKKIWVKCINKDYHNSYLTTCSDFSTGSRCPYCASQKIHPKDSFAQYHIDNTDKNFIEKYWSDKNTLNPWELSVSSGKKIWIKCQNDKEHEDYEIACNKFKIGRRCPKCNESKGERKIREILNTYDIDFIPQKEFSDLVGTSEWKPLSYDFYLPKYNLLIEYQGEYHDGTAKNQTEEQFIKQQEHDKRKRNYAELHNIKLLEIWYQDFKNIETILNKNIK